MLIEAKAHIDPKNDTAELVIDLVGTDPFQHEFLKAVFAADLCTQEDEKAGQPDAAAHAKYLGSEDVRIRFVTKTPGAFEKAKRAMENKRRADNGEPSLEEEEAKAKEAAKAEQLAKQRKGRKAADDSDDSDDSAT